MAEATDDRWLDAANPTELDALAQALLDGRIAPPYSSGVVRLAGFGPDADAFLKHLAASAPSNIAWMLRRLAGERRKAADRIASVAQLVWSGAAEGEQATRDTRAVVDTLFARAERYVLVSTYVISDGQAVFARLAQRVRERPGLEVEMYLNIRPDMDAVDEAECVANFAASFARDHWPADVAPPALYYDPESLRLGPKRTTLHAKCVVVDGRWALVTSANFTEAAQERNIEAGVVLDHPRLAETLVARFRGLRDSRRLKRVP